MTIKSNSMSAAKISKTYKAEYERENLRAGTPSSSHSRKTEMKNHLEIQLNKSLEVPERANNCFFRQPCQAIFCEAASDSQGPNPAARQIFAPGSSLLFGVRRRLCVCRRFGSVSDWAFSR
jgi:hypothetical protein